MKTIYTTIAKFIVMTFVVLISFTSCSTADDIENSLSSVIDEQYTSIDVTYTYEVPEELFKYAEITACWNTADFTDAKWAPVLDTVFVHSYHITKKNVTAPVVLIYELTNRPAGGVNVDWTISMDMEIKCYKDNELVNVITKRYEHKIVGDAGAGLSAMIADVHTRTFGVKILKNGKMDIYPKL